MKKNKKIDLAGRIFAGVVIGGSILGTAAFLLSAPYRADYAMQPIEPMPEDSPAPKEHTVTISEEPAAKKPELALAHEETNVDFVEVADQALKEGDLKAALTALRKSLSNAPGTVEVLLRTGRIGREVGDLQIAEMALDEALRLDPRAVDVEVELARIQLGQDRFTDAHDSATRAINLDKENATAWNLVGRSSMSLSNWQRAEAALSRAVELDPLNAMFRNNLGLLFIKMKRADDAVDELETAIELFEDDAPYFTFNNLGLAHEMAGNYEDARAAFEEALTISPFYARAKVNLDRIEKQIAASEEREAFDTAKLLTPDLEIDGQESL